MFSDVATKLDLQQLKTEFVRELTLRISLVLAGEIALVFGMPKMF